MSEKDQEAPGEEEVPAGMEGTAAEAGEPHGEDAGSQSEADRIAALEAEAADYRNRLLRELAEMENLRKRTQREKEDAARFAITRFARDIVSVSDDLSRAIEAVAEDARSESDGPVAQLVAGIELIERQLQQVFERHGVTRFSPVGEKFDPTFHEAMFEYPDPTQPAGTVAQVVEAGYMIGERVLRPARVGVSAGGPKAEAPSAPPSEEPEPAEAAPEDEAPGTTEAPQAGTATPPQQPEPPRPEQIGIKIDRSA